MQTKSKGRKEKNTQVKENGKKKREKKRAIIMSELVVADTTTYPSQGPHVTFVGLPDGHPDGVRMGFHNPTSIRCLRAAQGSVCVTYNDAFVDVTCVYVTDDAQNCIVVGTPRGVYVCMANAELVLHDGRIIPTPSSVACIGAGISGETVCLGFGNGEFGILNIETCEVVVTVETCVHPMPIRQVFVHMPSRSVFALQDTGILIGVKVSQDGSELSPECTFFHVITAKSEEVGKIALLSHPRVPTATVIAATHGKLIKTLHLNDTCTEVAIELTIHQSRCLGSDKECPPRI